MPGRIAAAAHGVGALAWADAVHLAPHRRLRARELGLDVLLCSPYKFFGPHLGVAAIRPELAASLPADRVRPAAEDPAGHRFETGTQSHEAIAGTLAAVEYLRSLGDGGGLDAAFDRIRAHEKTPQGRFLSGAAGRLELYGIRTPEGRTPTFCFNLGGRRRARWPAARRARHLRVGRRLLRARADASARAVDRGGAVRAGFLHYTTEDEVDRLLRR